MDILFGIVILICTLLGVGFMVETSTSGHEDMLQDAYDKGFENGQRSVKE